MYSPTLKSAAKVKNLEKATAYGIQEENNQTKNTTQHVSDTIIHK